MVKISRPVGGIPLDQNSSNMDNYTSFLQSFILKIEQFVVLKLTSYLFKI